jgi:hypothetical protein
MPSVQQAAERILAGLRARVVRAKRRRRLENLEKWSGRLPSVPEPALLPDGRGLQRSGILRTQAQSGSGEDRYLDPEIKDNRSLQEQYAAYRVEKRQALKASENEAWRKAWMQEEATRQQETDRLRRSERVKRRLIVEGLPSGRFRRVWLEGLKLRCRNKRARLEKHQAERWATIRSEWAANNTNEELLGYKAWLREYASVDPVAARQYAWIDSMDARRAASKAMPAAQGAEHDEHLMHLSVTEAMQPNTIASAEARGQAEADPARHSDVERSPTNRSPGDIRLLAAAKFRAKRVDQLNTEIIGGDKESAECAEQADLEVPSRVRDVDSQAVSTIGGISPDRAGVSSVIAVPQVEAAHIATGAPLHAGTDPDASGIKGSVRVTGMSSGAEHRGTEDAQPSHSGINFIEQAREVALSFQARTSSGGIMPGGASRDPSEGARAAAPGLEVSARVNSEAEYQGREVQQDSHLRISIGEQVREVALRSQTEAAQGGVVPDAMSVDPRHETRKTDQAIQIKTPNSPALPTTVEKTVELPKTSDRPKPSYKPGEQGKASAPSMSSASGSIEPPAPAPRPSESESPALVAQLAPEPMPNVQQVTVQLGPEPDAAPTDAGSTTTQAPAPILVPKSLAPTAPPLPPVHSVEDAAMKAVAALRVQHPPTSPDPLRNIAKAVGQSLSQLQTETAPPASAQTDQPIQVETFNPIEDKDGQRHNPLLQQIGATIIYAFDREKQDLLDAAGTLLGVYLDEQEETAVYVAGGIVKWHNKPNAWPNMPRPLSIADCGRVTERIVTERQASRGDDWMWSWKGLPPDRVPPRPDLGSRKDFGIDD